MYRNAVKPPTPEILLPSTSLESCPNDMNLKHELLDKLVRTATSYFFVVECTDRVMRCFLQVILKLNGGLGTTLGCEGPKSAIEVRQDLSFLDLTVRQVEVCIRFDALHLITCY